MQKIAIKAAWTFCDESGREIDPHLFPLLRAIHETGKLTAAADAVGLSYRHAWNLVGKWTTFFGYPLVDLVRGHGATLTPLGAKFVWVEERLRAQLSPQLDSLASELHMGIQQALADINPTLRIHASHGFAIALLPELVAANSEIKLDLQYRGSLESLALLHRGNTDLAGFHVPDGEVAERVASKFLQWLKPRAHRLIYLARRQQGLMVPHGNPMGVHGIEDLARPELYFVNRQYGSGTRVLLDQLVEDLGIETNSINGYENSEFTHAAVAAHVASGMADVGFGLEAAARKFELDFIPVATERYLLATHVDAIESGPIDTLIQLIRSQQFADMVKPIPGYDATGAGKIVTVVDILPWAEQKR